MKIKILEHTYDVQEVPDDFNRNWGQSDPKHGWIKISTGMPKAMKESTLLHEVIHCISDTLDAGLDSQENKVSALAVGLYSFIKNNPELIRQMLDE